MSLNTILTCSNGHAVDSAAKFCTQCGASLELDSEAVAALSLQKAGTADTIVDSSAGVRVLLGRIKNLANHAANEGRKHPKTVAVGCIIVVAAAFVPKAIGGASAASKCQARVMHFVKAANNEDTVGVSMDLYNGAKAKLSSAEFDVFDSVAYGDTHSLSDTKVDSVELGAISEEVLRACQVAVSK